MALITGCNYLVYLRFTCFVSWTQIAPRGQETACPLTKQHLAGTWQSEHGDIHRMKNDGCIAQKLPRLGLSPTLCWLGSSPKCSSHLSMQSHEAGSTTRPCDRSKQWLWEVEKLPHTGSWGQGGWNPGFLAFKVSEWAEEESRVNVPRSHFCKTEKEDKDTRPSHPQLRNRKRQVSKVKPRGIQYL